MRLMHSSAALNAFMFLGRAALLVSVYGRLYELVAAPLSESDGEALNGAIDWANCSPSAAS